MKFPQTIGNINAPTKELERLIREGNLYLDNNPVTRFCFRNVFLVKDNNGNVRPDKSKSGDKIDGVASVIDALGAAIKDITPNSEI